MQTQIRLQRTRRLIKVCTVCLNYRKLRVKWNSFKSPFRTILQVYTQETVYGSTRAVRTRGRGGGGGGGGGGLLRGNFGTGVRASISKPTPFIYLAFEKTDPFIYLIIQNFDLFIYCPLIFLYPFFAGCYTNITVNSCNTKRINSLEKSLSEKYVHIPGCQNNGAFHIGIQKNRAIHILFVEKKGANHIPGSAEKGGYSARTSVLCHI